jgi:WD40 repeat protein
LPQYLEQRDCSFYCWLRGIAFEKLIEAHRRHILSGRRSVLQEARGTARLSDESEILLAEQFLASGTSPSGAGADNLVKLWDSTTQARLFELSGHEATVICLAFAPDNQILASGSTDGDHSLIGFLSRWRAAVARLW